MNSARALKVDLPPPFRLIALREVGDAFGHARAHATELGAGTLVHVGRFDLAEFAVVLEPDEPLVSARLTFYAGMVALGDALASLAAPEKPISIEWPDALHVDGGIMGGGRLGWPEGASEAVVPDWLVFGAAIRIVSVTGNDAGLHPFATTLEEEGFGDAGSGRLLERFARYLMVAFDRWRESRLAAIAEAYISKLRREGGVRYAIGENGDLLTARGSKPLERRELVQKLATPSWLAAQSGGLHV